MKSRKGSKGNTNHGGIIKQLKADVSTIYKTVYQGNGKPSIITQIAGLESRLSTEHELLKKQISELSQDIRMRIVDSVNLANDRCKVTEENFELRIKNLDKEIELKFKNVTDVVNEKFNSIAYQIRQEFDKRKTESTGAWNYRVAVITASLASFTSIFVVLLSEFLKRISS